MDSANCDLITFIHLSAAASPEGFITMKALCVLMRVICCLAICAGLAQADSMQLRNGRHLQGKYVGGTTSSIGFMTAGTVEYYAISDVLVLIFDNNDSPLSGLQPNPNAKRCYWIALGLLRLARQGRQVASSPIFTNRSASCRDQYFGLLKRRLHHMDNIVPDGIQHQVAHRVQFQLAHDVGAMSFRGLHT